MRAADERSLDTLTTGIVSALDRSLPGDRWLDLLMSDSDRCHDQPSNSGGPSIDRAGRLIGINTAIFSPSGANAGVGFAVPVDTVNRVVPQLTIELTVELEAAGEPATL